MPITTLAAPCWRLVDGTGREWPDDPGPTHHHDAADALTYYDGPEGLTLAAYDRPCVVVTCDGCGDEPEDDEFAHIHFPDEETASGALDVYEYRNVGGQVWCANCRLKPHAHVGGTHCARCDGLEDDHEYALPVAR